jgi:predicted DNA-binding transcriptional regulator AlpA
MNNIKLGQIRPDNAVHVPPAPFPHPASPKLTTNPAASRLIKINRVKEQIEVSSTTLWRMEKRGDLVPVRINGTRFWRQEDLDQLVAVGGA